MSYFSHLECSASCGVDAYDPHLIHHLCSCGAPLLARYDLERARAWKKDSLRTRAPDMWRYRELMPLCKGDRTVSLGEGYTPLIHAKSLGRALGFLSLYIKDESQNPTQSFKARGLSAAVTRALALGVKTLSIPSAGNAGSALAAYAACAQLEAKVFLPRDVKKPFIQECSLYGADVTLVEGLITDAGRLAADRGRPLGWYDVSTLREPYRIEGKKTMAYEIAEQLEWRWPDWVIYPTGGGTGLIGMWKAFDELERIGWMPEGRRPRLVSVQADGCAPIVRAFHEHSARATPWDNARTVADGLRVPQAIGDFLMLKALAESGGTAVSVSDDQMIVGMRDLGCYEGVSAAPEGGATVAALRALKADGTIKPDDTVVLFNTGGALKYLELMDK
jgi:threonine synthase